VCSLALFTSPWWLSREERKNSLEMSSLPSINASILLVVVIFIQLILGALVRHTQSALVIPDFPLAYGQILPSLTQASVNAYNETLIQENVRLFADGPVTQNQIIIALLHRIWALVVTGLVIWNSVKLWRCRTSDFRFGFLASSLLGVVAVQIILGASVVLTLRIPEIATAHQTFGATLLMVSVIAVLHVWRFLKGEIDSNSQGEDGILATNRRYIVS